MTAHLLPHPPLPPALASAAAYHDAFRQGLERMLAEHEDLGVYILVLANAAFDAELWAPLRAGLAERHERLAARVRDALRHGRRVPAPEDDLLVFLQLMALGFEHVGRCETRALPGWEVQYNPVRALRPPRASGQAIDGLLAAFDDAGFHFNKPFLQRERIWSGDLLGRGVDLYYNKFPFIRLHGLLVPERDLRLPQYLTPALHDYAWRLADALGRVLPGVGLAYNSLGAHASVNHLHFQLFARPEPLPVEAPACAHNGGNLDYPAACQVSSEVLDAWLRIAELHERACPYNLVYRPGRLLLLPRRAQGRYAPPAWGGGLAWYEMAGCVPVFGRDEFDSLNDADLRAALAATRPAWS